MREHGRTIGGESSGHIVLLQHNTTGDATIAALQVLAILIAKDQSLSDLARVYQELPEAHQKVPLNGKHKPEQGALNALAAEVEQEIQDSGRVVIRPSGTEPIVRIMVQHENLRTAEQLCTQLAERVAAL